MTISAAYAELGGGVHATRPADVAPAPMPTPARSAPRGATGCRHLFDPDSGWCGCGLRDDGLIAEGSPAWRAAVDHAMPAPGQGCAESAHPSEHTA